MKIEKFTNRLNYRMGLKLANIGWDIWCPKQYLIKENEQPQKTEFELEPAAIVEMMGNKLIYCPTYEQTYNFILSTDMGWVLTVEYNVDYDAWYFVIKNYKEGEYHNYHYKQPITPKMKYADAFVWGLEHILNRYPENDDIANTL